MTANSPDVTAFDPDFREAQPAGALEALIARTEGAVGELQFPRCSKDDSLNRWAVAGGGGPPRDPRVHADGLIALG